MSRWTRRGRRGGAPSRRREIGAGRVFLGLVADHDDRPDPLGGELARDRGTVRPPSSGWPPVIATASLNSTL
jgi:hypothetical protein